MDAALPLVPDLLAPNLSVVFCGTALGTRSAALRQYYAHPQNKFYAALHEAGLTPHRIAPADYATLLAYGIGMTDVNKVEFGMDHALTPAAADADALREKIRRYAPRRLAFTSKNAASYFYARPTGKLAYGPQAERFATTELWILPSPSPAAQTSWDMRVWKALGEAVRSTTS